jgi:hypothetical protein
MTMRYKVVREKIQDPKQLFFSFSIGLTQGYSTHNQCYRPPPFLPFEGVFSFAPAVAVVVVLEAIFEIPDVKAEAADGEPDRGVSGMIVSSIGFIASVSDNVKPESLFRLLSWLPALLEFLAGSGEVVSVAVDVTDDLVGVRVLSVLGEDVDEPLEELACRSRPLLSSSSSRRRTSTSPCTTTPSSQL